jgi:tetratricopeptide (TPR) repeat protein
MPFEEVATEAAEPFESLTQLRIEHVQLMRAARRDSRDEELIGRVRRFSNRARATGARLDSSADREAAQDIISYWTSYLFTVGDRETLSAAPPVLDPFDPANAPDLSSMANPYQGLNPFDEGDALRFFGREEAAKTLLDRLRDEPAVVVIGPKGSGKTSLVMAGVIPRLKSRMIVENKNAVVIVVVPRGDPFGALVRSIHEAAADVGLPSPSAWVPDQQTKLERSPESLRVLLGTVFPGRLVTVFVDQFEEVFTLCTDPQVRERFAQALMAISFNGQGLYRFILAIDERYQQPTFLLGALNPLTSNPRAFFFLTPLTAAEVCRAIESAASTVGLKFDDGIVEDLAKETAGDVGALATLQFALDKLWNERNRDRITWEAYVKVGRPRKALARAADAVYDGLSSEDDRVAVKKLFLQLVRPTIEGSFIRRRVQRDILLQLDLPDRMARVLEQCRQAGLIRYTPGLERDQDLFELPHESLVNGWHRLRDWLSKEKEDSEKKLQLVATARLYQESDPKSKSGYLLSGDALEEAARYIDAAPELAELVAASREARRRRSRLVHWIGFAIIVIIVLTTIFAGVQWYRADQEAKLAQEGASNAIELLSRTADLIKDLAARGSIQAPVAADLLGLSGPNSGVQQYLEIVEQTPTLIAARANLLIDYVDVYKWIGNSNQACASAEQAELLADKLVKIEPNNPKSQELLYASSYRRGDCASDASRMLKNSPPEYDRALERASREYKLALTAARQLAEKDPDPAKKENVAFIANKLGDVSLLRQEQGQAEGEYKISLAVGEDLVHREPQNPKWRKIVGDVLQRLGLLYVKLNRPDEALDQYESAVSIQRQLVESDQENTIYLSNVATTYDRIGDVYKSEKKLNKAAQKYDEALAIIKNKLIPSDPDNVQWQTALEHEYKAIRELAETYGLLGDALKEQGERGNNQDVLQQALGAYQNGLGVYEMILGKDPRSGVDKEWDAMQEKVRNLEQNIRR